MTRCDTGAGRDSGSLLPLPESYTGENGRIGKVIAGPTGGQRVRFGRNTDPERVRAMIVALEGIVSRCCFPLARASGSTSRRA